MDEFAQMVREKGPSSGKYDAEIVRENFTRSIQVTNSIGNYGGVYAEEVEIYNWWKWL